MKAFLVTIFLLLAMPGVAQTQSPSTDDWNNLYRFQVGDRVLIEKTNGEKIKGRFAALSDEAISILRGKKEVGVQKPEVSRVWLQTGDQKGWGVIIGAGAGTATFLKWAFDQGGNPLRGEDSGVTYVAAAGAGAIGAGVGALIGSRIKKHTLIYKAPPPSPAAGKSHSIKTERSQP